jgi:hypothetical protein
MRCGGGYKTTSSRSSLLTRWGPVPLSKASLGLLFSRRLLLRHGGGGTLQRVRFAILSPVTKLAARLARTGSPGHSGALRTASNCLVNVVDGRLGPGHCDHGCGLGCENHSASAVTHPARCGLRPNCDGGPYSCPYPFRPSLPPVL